MKFLGTFTKMKDKFSIYCIANLNSLTFGSEIKIHIVTTSMPIADSILSVAWGPNG